MDLALRLGLSSPVVASGGGYTPTNAEAAALYARMSPTPNDARKAIIDTLIGALKTGATSATNIWAKIDVLYVLAADVEANALLEWKGNTAYNGVKNGTPTFTADRGFVITNAGGDYISTGYTPATSSLGFAQDSAHIGAYVTTDSTAPGSDISFQANANRVVAKGGGGQAFSALNSTTGALGNAPVGNAPHHIVGNRSGSATFAGYRNGVAGSNVATASSNVGGSAALLVGAGSTVAGGSGRQVAINHCGIALSTAEILDSYNAFKAYLTAIGSPA